VVWVRPHKKKLMRERIGKHSIIIHSCRGWGILTRIEIEEVRGAGKPSMQALAVGAKKFVGKDADQFFAKTSFRGKGEGGREELWDWATWMAYGGSVTGGGGVIGVGGGSLGDNGGRGVGLGDGGGGGGGGVGVRTTQ